MVLLLVVATGTLGAQVRVPAETLAVRVGSKWSPWWTSLGAPLVWAKPHPTIQRALKWTTTKAGIEWASIDLRTAEMGRDVRVTVVRIDVRRWRPEVHARGTRAAGLLPWSIDHAPEDALVAVNAGQFTDDGPWGWVVHRGSQLQAVGEGALSMALVVDSASGVRMYARSELGRLDAGGIQEAFQSYPALLIDGRLPEALVDGSGAVDIRHRDTRLALGLTREGVLVLALTRMTLLGQELTALPLGLTTPEMAALMGALGAHRAVMLDGGLSSQLLVRVPGGKGVERHGLREVPLGLVFRPR